MTFGSPLLFLDLRSLTRCKAYHIAGSGGPDNFVKYANVQYNFISFFEKDVLKVYGQIRYNQAITDRLRWIAYSLL